MPTLVGYDVTGGTVESSGAATGFPVFLKFVAVATGTALRVVTHTRGSSGSVGLTMGIYADNGGVPGSKLGTTSEVTATTTPADYAAALGAGVSIVSGTTYWLCVDTSGSRHLYYDTAAFDTRFGTDTYSAGVLPGNNPSSSSWYTDRSMTVWADDGGPDVAPPTLSGAATNSAGDSITATLSESGCTADGGGSSGTGGFTLSGTSATVSGWSISGTTLTLTLSGAVANGVAVTYSYSRSSTTDDIKDAAGNYLANFSSAAVTNNVPGIKNVCVWLGDSNVAGFGATADKCTIELQAILGTLEWDVFNEGVPSETFANMLARVDTDVAPHFDPDADHNVCVVSGWTNDYGLISSGTSAADAVAAVLPTLDDLVAAVRAAGFTVVVETAMPNTQIVGSTIFNARRNLSNNTLRAGWRFRGIAALADTGFDGRVGVDGAELSGAYQSDHVHYVDATHTIRAQYAAQAIASALYPDSPSSAPSRQITRSR